MLAADDFYDVLAAKERQLEDEWRAEHGVETEPTLTRTQELRERYLQKASGLGLLSGGVLAAATSASPEPRGTRRVRFQQHHTNSTNSSPRASSGSSSGGGSPPRRPHTSQAPRRHRSPGRAALNARPATAAWTPGLSAARNRTNSSAAAALAATERALLGGPSRRRRGGRSGSSTGPFGSDVDERSESESDRSEESDSSSSPYSLGYGARPSSSRSAGHSRGARAHRGGGYGSDHALEYGGRRYGSPAVEGRGQQYERQLRLIERGRRGRGTAAAGAGEEPTVAFLRTWRAIKNREALHREVVRFLVSTPEELEDQEGSRSRQPPPPPLATPASPQPPLPPAPSPGVGLQSPPQLSQQPYNALGYGTTATAVQPPALPYSQPEAHQHRSYSYHAVNQGTQAPSPRTTASDGGAGLGSTLGTARAVPSQDFVFHAATSSPPSSTPPPSAGGVLQSAPSFRRLEGLSIDIPEPDTPRSLAASRRTSSVHPAAASPRSTAGGGNSLADGRPSGGSVATAGSDVAGGGGARAGIWRTGTGQLSLDGWVGAQGGRPDATFAQLRTQQDTISRDVQAVLARLAQVRSKLGDG